MNPSEERKGFTWNNPFLRIYSRILSGIFIRSFMITSSTDSNVISFDLNQIEEIKSALTGGRFYSDRISLTLCLKLYFSLHSFYIYDQIDYLEKAKVRSITKKEKQFKGSLFPFWHKHYFVPANIFKNISLRWGFENGGNKDFDKMLNLPSSAHGHNEDLWPKCLSHALTVEAYKDRVTRGLTGDWIIYAKHDGINYYLDIAQHEDGIDEKSKHLRQRLNNISQLEFPFLLDS